MAATAVCRKHSVYSRLILAAGSEVLYAMLLGPVAEKELSIRIPDLHPAAFRQMLMYVVLRNHSSVFYFATDFCCGISEPNHLITMIPMTEPFFSFIGFCTRTKLR